MVLKYLPIVTLMMILPMEKADTSEGLLIRHSLPLNRLVSIYGSQFCGGCRSVICNNSNICNGTSVLNDGIIPTLNGVSNNSGSLWATNLFTMRRPGVAGNIIVSFEVEPVKHNYMKLAVFNCPELEISTPMVNVYSSTTFRPEDKNKTLGKLIASYISANSSCSSLITYIIEFYQNTSLSFFNLEFPFVNGSSSSFVFLGEVAFLIAMHNYHTTALPTATATVSCSGQERDLPPCQIGVAIVSTAAVTVAITASLSMAIHFAVYKCINKIKAKFLKQKGITPSKSDKFNADETDMYEPV